jgi:iron-sulfur cluster assembly protein
MIDITFNAREKLLDNIMERDCLGIRARVATAGCNGLTYILEYVNKDEDISQDKVFIEMLFIDPKSYIVLAGSELDYKVKDLSEGFEFNNPNETNKCGCGESFYVS